MTKNAHQVMLSMTSDSGETRVLAVASLPAAAGCEEPVWRCSVVGPRPHLRRSGHIDTSNTNPPHLVASGNFALCAFSIISLSHDFTLELLTNSAFKTLPSASTVSLITAV